MTDKTCGVLDTAAADEVAVYNKFHTSNKVEFKTHKNSDPARGFKALVCIQEFFDLYYDFLYPVVTG